MKKYIDYLTGDLTRAEWTNTPQEIAIYRDARLREIKPMFAKLINAKPSEIAFVKSTQIGENLVVNGMDIQTSGGNVVTNDLHYESCLHSYKMRQKAGLDVRIVKHRDWQIDIRDMEKAVDRKTKLIAVTLVSNVNGLLQDVKAMSSLAHAHGAYLFADIIQGAGAVPIDVRALGIDMASCSTYKWLMGLRGFAYLYIREDLQGTVIKPTEFGGGVRFNYAPWATASAPGAPDIDFTPRKGASAFEVGNVSNVGSFCQYESLQYIQRLGIENIRAHVRPLTTRLQKELPAMGYPCITPKNNESPIVTFLVKDSKATAEKLRRANIELTLRFGNHMRIAVSVFNNNEDVDRLLQALA
jgi:selenocysteine lyase/cysteine desulfurase